MRMRLAAVLAALAAAPAEAQSAPDAPAPGTDSVTLVAGPRYQASGLHQFLFGRRYRKLWAAPVRVPVLDLGSGDGTLEPVEQGGGMQTTSLRLRDRSGRQYVFRSVDKDPSEVLPPGLRSGEVLRIVQDQISSAHPAGALVACRLLDATPVLHVRPRLMVMADDPRLGQYREKFAGMFGLFERYPDELPDDEPGFAGFDKITGSDELLARLNESPDHRVDVRAFLTARLMDLVLNDWDRHEGQWRWARREGEERTRWIPIPRDRDQAMVWFDGVLPSLARLGAPRLVAFGPDYPLAGLVTNSSDLDRRLLVELDRPVWDSVAQALVTALTDSVIDASVAAMPPEYYALGGLAAAATLKARRDALPGAARRFYERLSGVVDLHATDAADVAELARLDDGSLEVRLFDGRDSSAAAEPYLRRRLFPKETREVRVYLHGGDDRATVRGDGPGRIVVRLIGGNGENRLADSSRAGDARLYDAGRVDGVTYGVDTLFARRPWELRHGVLTAPAPDAGGAMKPGFGVRVVNDLGIVAQVGVDLVRHGFRRRPYASRVGLSLEYSSGADLARLTLDGARHREDGRWYPTFLVRLSGLEMVRYHGLGNETPGPGEGDFFRTGQRQYLLQPGLGVPLGRHARATAGLALRYTTTARDSDRFVGLAEPYGTGDLGQLALRGGVELDTRDAPRASTRGVRLALDGSLSPAAWHVDETFGWLAAEATGFVRLPGPPGTIGALRLGGKRVWGTYPYFEAATVGGLSTVRGLPEQRFAGDASLYGGADLRFPVARVRAPVPARLGLILLGDVGRVFRKGERSRRWHGGAGGGISVDVPGTGYGFSMLVADSRERTGLYLQGGFAF